MFGHPLVHFFILRFARGDKNAALFRLLLAQLERIVAFSAPAATDDKSCLGFNLAQRASLGFKKYRLGHFKYFHQIFQATILIALNA